MTSIATRGTPAFPPLSRPTQQRASAQRLASRRQRSEQYRTSSHTRAHFRRQAKGRPQYAQTRTGRSALRRIRPPMAPYSASSIASPVETVACPGLSSTFSDSTLPSFTTIE